MSEARTFLPEPDVLDNEDVAAAYSRWAPIYDLTFERVMRPGRCAIAAATAHMEGPLLDVGVGTGLELPMFARQLEVTGIDDWSPEDVARLQRHLDERRAEELSKDGGEETVDG